MIKTSKSFHKILSIIILTRWQIVCMKPQHLKSASQLFFLFWHFFYLNSGQARPGPGRSRGVQEIQEIQEVSGMSRRYHRVGGDAEAAVR